MIGACRCSLQTLSSARAHMLLAHPGGHPALGDLAVDVDVDVDADAEAEADADAEHTAAPGLSPSLYRSRTRCSWTSQATPPASGALLCSTCPRSLAFPCRIAKATKYILTQYIPPRSRSCSPVLGPARQMGRGLRNKNQKQVPISGTFRKAHKPSWPPLLQHRFGLPACRMHNTGAELQGLEASFISPLV